MNDILRVLGLITTVLSTLNLAIHDDITIHIRTAQLSTIGRVKYTFSNKLT